MHFQFPPQTTIFNISIMWVINILEFILKKIADRARHLELSFNFVAYHWVSEWLLLPCLCNGNNNTVLYLVPGITYGTSLTRTLTKTEEDYTLHTHYAQRTTHNILELNYRHSTAAVLNLSTTNPSSCCCIIIEKESAEKFILRIWMNQYRIHLVT